MSGEQDYYRLLGISRDSPEREIKKAYYELARKLHPDKAKDDEERNGNANRLAAISKAYNTLKDPKKRAEYDATIRGKTANSPPPEPPSVTPAASSTSAPIQPATPARRPAAQKGQAVATVSGIPQPEASPDDEARKASLIYQQKKQMAQKAFVRGMQHFKRSEFKEALSFFEVAATNDPESEAQYHIKYAQCLMKMKGSFTKAAEHAERACQMDPYNIEFKLMLGEIYETAGGVSKAREIYEDVLRWDATNREAKNRLQFLGASSGGGGAANVLNKLTSLFNKKK